MHLALKLSSEHVGFTFVSDLLVASGLVKLHSGGVCSEAAIRAMKGKGRREEEVKIMSTRVEEEEVRMNFIRYQARDLVLTPPLLPSG